VSGWALDDIQVTRVTIWRNPAPGEYTPHGNGLVYIGDAVFLEDARPDVAAVFPQAPLNYRGGWGYLMLTRGLPNGGNGTFDISVYAQDAEGKQTRLGVRRISVTNATAVKPFGSIDTPGQGETVSGVIFNWGWAITPNPANYIPNDGSTITVHIDGVAAGHPVYGLYRSDIATAFPGFANSDSAVGYFVIDTRTLSNGVHTLGWLVTDSAGNTEGIGSRFFRVRN
jgi:hypothetical protein